MELVDSPEGADRTYAHGDVTMAYTETRGPGERVFVLIHGLGMGRIVFAGVAALLGRHGRVLAVDLPGFGDSPEPGTAASLEETAGVIAQFIRDGAPGGAVLVGHSMGTQIVAEVALHHPELVDGLVLIAPTVNRHERSARKQAFRMLQDLSGESPKVLLLGLWEYARTNPVWFANKLRFMLRHRLEGVCSRIGTPALVLRGEKDRVCPHGWVSEVAEALPHAEMAEISGRGHEAIIRSPQPVASMILDFAARAESGAR